MIPLHHDPFYTFRFAEDRMIPRFHLEGMPSGQLIRVHRADPATLRPGALLTTAPVGTGGWVDLAQPLLVRAGEVFVVLPERAAIG